MLRDIAETGVDATKRHLLGFRAGFARAFTAVLLPLATKLGKKALYWLWFAEFSELDGPTMLG